MRNSQGSTYRSNGFVLVLAAAMCFAMGAGAWASPDMGDRAGMDGHHGMMMQGHEGMGMGKGGGYAKHGMRPHNAAAHFLKMGDMLDLTADQSAKLTKLRDDYIAKHAATEQQLKAAYDDLPRVLYVDGVETKATDALFDKIGKLESELWRAYAQQLKEIHAILTAEQRETLKAWREMRHPGMDGTRGGDMPMHRDMR